MKNHEKSSKNQVQDFQNRIKFFKGLSQIKILSYQNLLNDPLNIAWKFQGDCLKTAEKYRNLDSFSVRAIENCWRNTITHERWPLTNDNFS